MARRAKASGTTARDARSDQRFDCAWWMDTPYITAPAFSRMLTPRIELAARKISDTRPSPPARQNKTAAWPGAVCSRRCAVIGRLPCSAWCRAVCIGRCRGRGHGPVGPFADHDAHGQGRVRTCADACFGRRVAPGALRRCQAALPPAWLWLGQDLRPVLGDGDGVLGVGGEAAVGGDHGPLVVEEAGPGAPHAD